jgi:DNA-binding CsgD family transcriptional regulator
MQRHSTVEALRDEAGLDARARRKGVRMRFVLPRRVAERRCPLASSYFPYLRIAPVAHPLMISDGTRILLGDASGDTIWMSEDPQVVARAVTFYDELWASAVPAVPEGRSPPFTPRMVAIGVLVAEGATDGEIARSLGVSERTVSSDVREMSRRLGARSRAHAISLISGVEG